MTGVEPGLENAVKWKWRVVPSDPSSWGLELPEPPPTPTPAPAAVSAVATPTPAPGTYQVRAGDALAKIAKTHGRTIAQIKAANGLASDMIHIGDTLKIPTLEECIALGVPPAPPPTAKKPAARGVPAGLDLEILRQQIFLDQKNFSAAPLDGNPSPAFQKLTYLYQQASGQDTLVADARAAIPEPTTAYRLRPEDFRFIAPPKPEKIPAIKKGKAPPEKPASPAPVYQEMTSAKMLAYRSPWEFVAERFHANESLIKELNPSIKNQPLAGTELLVPNVRPFEIETAPELVPRPPADPARIMTAVIMDLSLMEIYENDRLVAILPVSPARPGLRGKSAWKIMDAIPRPRLATLRESKDPGPAVSSFYAGEKPVVKSAVLSAEEFLPAGPNNPAGILWINLMKTDPPEILPYGLHGTSIPGKMNSLASIGGFRMSNWDILRAAKLLPEGSQLLWKKSLAPTAAPAGR